jgi:hypothetical protein
VNKKAFADEIRHRRAWIVAADDLCRDCEQLTTTPADASLEAGRHWRRAAKLYGMAAEHYRRAGLGLRAIVAWQAAATCYAALGLESDRERCALGAAAIPTYDTPDTPDTPRPTTTKNGKDDDPTHDPTHDPDKEQP